jgi:hypothetical protein
MANPTRLTSGLATVPAVKPLGKYPLPDPFHTSGNSAFGVVSYINDFFDIGSTTAYVITGVASTFALASGIGGVAVLTPGAAATVSTYARAVNSFQFVAGQKFWYLTRLQLSGVGAGVISRAGLQVGSVAGTTQDAIYFTKLTGASGAVDLVSYVGGVATTLDSSVLPSTTAATWIDVGFYYDGKDLYVYANDALQSVIPNVTIGASGTTLSNAVLAPFAQITPVASETLSQDYILVAQEVVR